jgi:hypothetical protein
MYKIWTSYSYSSLSCSMMLRVITNSSYSNKTALICITTWGVNIIRWHTSQMGQAGCWRVTTGLLITPHGLYLWGYQGLTFTLPFCHITQKILKWHNDSWPEHSMMRLGTKCLLVGNVLCYQRSLQWAAATTCQKNLNTGRLLWIKKKFYVCVLSRNYTSSKLSTNL